MAAILGLRANVLSPYAFGHYGLANGERIDEQFWPVGGYAFRHYFSLFYAVLASILPQIAPPILAYFRQASRACAYCSHNAFNILQH